MVPACVSGVLLFQQGWLCGTVSIPSRKHSHHSQYRLQLLYICNASALNSLAAALTRLAAVSSLLRTYCYTVATPPISYTTHAISHQTMQYLSCHAHYSPHCTHSPSPSPCTPFTQHQSPLLASTQPTCPMHSIAVMNACLATHLHSSPH